MMSLGSGGAGLTPSGVQAVAQEHIEIDAPRRPRTLGLHSVQDMYRSLIVSEGAHTRADLIPHFRPVQGGDYDPDRGRYSERMSRGWWDDVGRPNLAALPGVEDDGDALTFTGVDADEFDEDHTRPLDDLRADPVVQVEAALDERGLARQTEPRTAIEAVVAHLADVQEATPDVLSRQLRRSDHSLDDLASDLGALPGVSRKTRTPPDPSEIEVETMADVLEGHERLAEGGAVVWRFTPDVPAPADGAEANDRARP